MITLTSEAAKEAELWRQREPEYSGQDLRMFVSGKGCDGFYYGVSFDTLDAEQDEVFESESSVRVGIDKESLPFVEGTTISWVNDDRGTGFWIDNPNHRKFLGKFFKKKNFSGWMKENRPDAAF